MQIAEQRHPLGMFLARPLSASVPISRELAIFIGLFVLAGLLRFWDLGSRMLHHDESLHAVYSYYLYTGKGYRHDPMMHGPLQFHMIALMYFLFGATDATARFYHAGLGTLLVFLPYFYRRYLGPTGAIFAAALLALLPTFLYFSRFAREDIPMPVWSLLFVLGMFRYLDTRRPAFLYLVVVATVLQFMTKESAYLNVTMFGLVLFVLTLVENPRQWLSLLSGRVQLTPAGDLLWALATITLPLGTALVVEVFQKVLNRPLEYFQMGILFVVVLSISIILGRRWNASLWTRAAVLFWGIFTVFYTTFFANPEGFATGSVGSLLYWMEQQGVARGNQPWYYYLLLLPLYDFVAVAFGLAGIVYWLIRRPTNLFATFLIYWALLSLVIYGWTSEKMPWLVIHISLPFVLLAAMTLGRLFEAVQWRRAYREGGIQTALALVLAILAGAALIGEGYPSFDGTMDLDTQRAIFRWIALLAAFAALVGAVAYYGHQLGRKLFLQLATVALFVVLMAFTLRTAFQATYYHGDIPVEMIVYTQTSPDVGAVMDEIERLTYRTGATKDTFRVVYDSGVSWPFEWYLREYTSKVFIGTGSNVPEDAPIVVVGFENDAAERMRQTLGDDYVSQRYRLRWWFPEDYRDLTPQKIVSDLADPVARTKLWRFLLYRETWNPLGSTDFLVFVRRDLASGAWVAVQTPPTSVETDLYQQRTRVIDASAIIGQSNDAAGPLNQPKDIAVGPRGEIYVADTFNHRVLRYDASGGVTGAWGSKGTGEGQFNEPWGIAVDRDGNVYVADTWNHRIQKFDATGQFVKSWGSANLQPGTRPGELFGPRDIAIDQDRNLYVTDTGNHRIQKFDGEGQLLQTFGGPGEGDGFFSEPVGLTIDRSGNILVADTWNQRVQKFSPTFELIAQWSVTAWDSRSIVNKPYIATDADGSIYVTDPENDRVIKFSSAGSIEVVWSMNGQDQSSFRLPTGISVDDDGNVYVADSQNNRLLKFAPVR